MCPVKESTKFKVLLPLGQATSVGSASAHIKKLFKSISTQLAYLSLCSAAHGDVLVPHCHTSTTEQHALTHWPLLWNSQ